MDKLVESPKWLTSSYLQKILQKKYSNNFEVQTFSLKQASNGGLVLRLTAQCVEDNVKTEKSLIIKTDFKSAEALNLVGDRDCHMKEMTMYADLIPRLNELLKSIGDPEQLAAEVLFVDFENRAIFLEDLKERKFKLADRKVGMDWNHLKVLVKKVAKMHACSMVLAAEGEKFEKFHKGLFDKDYPVFNPYYISGLELVAEEVKKWPVYEKYTEKLLDLAKRVCQQGEDMYEWKPNQFFVLNHGDCWPDNLMFHYDGNGEVDDLCLLDYRFSMFGSPFHDLIYGFHLSANDETKFDDGKFSELVKVYHGYLTDTLTRLSSTTKAPTLFQLHQECNERSFAMIPWTLILAVTSYEKENATSAEYLVADSEAARAFRKEIFTGPRFLRTMKHFLPLWDARGLLDPLKLS